MLKMYKALQPSQWRSYLSNGTTEWEHDQLNKNWRIFSYKYYKSETFSSEQQTCNTNKANHKTRMKYQYI